MARRRDIRRKPKEPKYGISQLEWVIILGFIMFGMIWSYVTPLLAHNPWFLSIPPPAQYFIYNMGTLLVITAVLGIPLDYFLENTISVFGMIKGGVISFTVFSLLDLYQPPFVYNNAGQLIITDPDSIPGAAIDRALGWTWTQLGVADANLYFAIYKLTPILTIIFIALLTKNQLMRLAKRQ